MAATVGVISDTHGLLREEAIAVLAGVSLIVHAGDVGSPEVLRALAEIAPVKAVRGNVDRDAWARKLPLTRTVTVEHARIFVLHDVAQLDFDPAARGYAAVISGHSHKAREEVRNGVLYLNPGSAGPRRFRLPVTLARLEVEGVKLRPELVALS
jgi:putative phosphoesterase